VKRSEVEIQDRELTGSACSRRDRRQGLIPSVIYSRNEGGQAVLLNYKDFVQEARKVRPSQIFTFKGDTALKGEQALVKDIQLDPVSGRVLHVDFQRIFAGEALKLPVPVSFLGEAVGVKNEGGILNVLSREVEVSCVPSKIPDEIQIDVSELSLGSGITAGELALPEGVELCIEPDEVIVSVVTVRATKLDEETPAEGEEGEEGAEGEEAQEGAEGEAESGKSEEKDKDKDSAKASRAKGTDTDK